MSRHYIPPIIVKLDIICVCSPFKTFRKKTDYSRHLLTHMGVKPFPCQLCGVRCSRRSSLKKHCVQIHGMSEDEFEDRYKI